MTVSLSPVSHRKAVFTVGALGALISAGLATIQMLFAGPAAHVLLAKLATLTPALAILSLVAVTFSLFLTGESAVDRALQSTAEARFLAAAACSLDALFLLDAVRGPKGEIEDFKFSFLNRHAQLLFNIPHTDLVGGSLCNLLPVFRAEGFFDQYKSIVKTGKQSTTEFSLDDKLINARWLKCSVVKLKDGLAVTASNLTERKEYEDRICHVAQHDALTGLPNRTLLDDRIQQAIMRAKRNRQSAAVLILDLDGFTEINDTYGQAAGDLVLRTVATRLRASVRASDSVFRLGGDEFVIVFGDLATNGPVADFARKIVISLLPPIPWHETNLNVSASIGVSMYPEAGSTPESLLVQADIAMYRMKRAHAAAATPVTADHLDLSVFPLMMN